MLRVINTHRGCIVAIGSSWPNIMKRMFGLLGRRGLDAGGGCGIQNPLPVFHTFFMAFKIMLWVWTAILRVIRLWPVSGAVAGDFGELQDEERLELPCGTVSLSRRKWGSATDFAIPARLVP